MKRMKYSYARVSTDGQTSGPIRGSDDRVLHPHVLPQFARRQHDPPRVLMAPQSLQVGASVCPSPTRLLIR
jgi:hypothetical protein